MRKITLFFVAAFATIGLSLPHEVSAKEENSTEEKSYTVEDYENYLQNYSPQDAINAGVNLDYVDEAVEESSKVLEEFKSLSKDDQQRTVESFFKPQMQTIGSDLEDDTMSILADKSVSYQNSVKFFGANQTTYRVSASYRVTSGKVKKILSSSAVVVRNWNPVVKTGLNKGGKSAWVTGDNKAAVKGSFYYQIGPIKDIGIQLGNVYLKAVGDKNGKRTYKKMWRD
ncbi:hypothetical protein MF621_004007 (plasmid) [Bacillus velezensis]|uniref:hypothetical protein n=1 Tax=Bacillus velezensis TaxID=492670 RepID=UPI0004A12446|nr:hypothetical protein [Bacillus velezensis]KDN91187.1 hypothetical protein EF87_20280 [Bacillus amyloliquefaciens]URJ76466.1 hypothetical protein MF619_004045 [Bacillus velezensis]URJ80422.1 hypothetical protein MF621_004007 [Bacillus velezensis]